jgi:uncharacterized protein YerC
MPHLSQHPLSSKHLRELDQLLFQALATTNMSTRKQVYSEIFTKTEKIMIAKRLQLLFLIQDGVPPYRICRKLRISPSTVARFQRAYERGNFTHTAKWLSRSKIPTKALRLFSEILEVHFGTFTAHQSKKRQ